VRSTATRLACPVKMWKKRVVEEDESAAAPQKRRRGAGASLLVDDDDEDEPMQQDDDDSADDLDSADEYDEDLFKGPADRAELNAKTDLEREMILADRHDRKQRRMETLQVRAEMRAQRAVSKQQTQRRGGARAAASAHADKSAKLAELAAKRQQSERRQKEKQMAEEREASDDESDGESAADAARRAAAEKRERAERARRDAEAEAEARQPKEGPAPFKQLERIRLTRQKLEKWINEPFFEDVVVGCFVRVGIGMQEGRATYRAAEIMGVKDGFRQYSIEKVVTTKRIELQIGSSRRYFQMNYISNTNFETPELEKYGRLMRAANMPTKTLTFINEKVKQLLDAKTHTYSEAEVAEKVKRERATQKMKGNLALRKIQLTNEIDGLKQRLRVKPTGDGPDEDEHKRKEEEEELSRLEEELKGLDKKEDLQKKLDEKREGSSFRIGDINERNRKFQREVEDKVGKRDLQDQVEISAGRVTASDPFKRLPIRPVIYWDVKAKQDDDNQGEAAATADATSGASADAAPAAALTVDPSVAETPAGESMGSPGLAPLLETPLVDDDAVALQDEQADGDEGEAATDEKGLPRLAGKRVQAHDIDIDIDIVDTEPVLPRARPLAGMAAARATTTSAPQASGQRLSLRDYKSRIEEA